GTAAVAWLKAQGTHDAVFGVRYQMEHLLSSVPEQRKHERLVQLAWQRKQPMLAEPSSGGASSDPAAAGGNPTGHPLLFGPVLHLGEPVALLEVVLRDARGPLA